MDVVAYVGLSQQMALQRQMAVIASNVANASTTGYQREMMQFEAFTETMKGTEIGSAAPVAFVLDHGVARDMTPGELTNTGNPLDVGIVGQGYFAVQAANGDTFYTRNGHFLLDNQGYIATLNGERLLGAGGQPMQIQPTDKQISVGVDGTVRSDVRDIGKIQTFQFDSALMLDRAGNNLLKARANATANPVKEVKVRSGMLETSNVQPIVEITQMIIVQRSYEQTAKMLDRMDDLRRQGNEKLARAQ